jgi:hypothetical protein
MSDDTLRTHGNRARYAQRVADAWSMRVRGADWATIATATGYANAQNAMRAVRTYAGSLPVIDAREDLRSLWRERLEHLWPLAVRDAEAGRPGALRASVAVAQRAAQLDGLDEPQRVHVTPGEEDLDRMVQRLIAMSGQTIVDDAEVIELDVIEVREIEAGEGDAEETPPSP